MAWDTTLVLKLRYYINDLDTIPTWTDTQLARFIAIAASVVSDYLQAWPIGGPYTIDFSIPSITPDPTDPNIPIGFSNIIVIKAAAILNNAELKKALASGGYKIVDDGSTIDTTSVVDAAKARLQMYTSDFDDSVKQYQYGNRYAGSAILAPYSQDGETLYPEWLKARGR